MRHYRNYFYFRLDEFDVVADGSNASSTTPSRQHSNFMVACGADLSKAATEERPLEKTLKSKSNLKPLEVYSNTKCEVNISSLFIIEI